MQGMAPSSSGDMVGRFYVPKSPLQGLARVFQTYAGVKGGEKADQASADVAQRSQTGRAAAIANALQIAQGTPGAPAPADDLGGGPAQPGQPGNPLAAYGALAASGDPMAMQTGTHMLGYLQKEKANQLGREAKKIQAEGATA